VAHSNDLTNVIPQILAQGLIVLRGAVVMPMMVNRDYENDARQKGDTIDIPISSAVSANDVVPDTTSQAVTDITPTKVQVTLDNWKEAAFSMTDKEMAEVMDGYLPLQAQEAVKALARAVNADVLAEYYRVFNTAGAYGSDPFGGGNIDELVDARRVMNEWLVPLDSRYCVFDPVAEAELLKVPGMQDASFRGDTEGFINGQIGRKMGFGLVMDQQIPSHTAGTASGYLVNDGGDTLAVGDTVVPVDTGTGTFNQGDLILFAGDTTQYSVQETLAGAGNLSIYPGLQADPGDGAAISYPASFASHTVNLAFHRDAFALATRPLSDDGLAAGRILSQTDPVSGLTLRLEVMREFRQTRWAFDILWGTKCVRPELACRVIGA
jgi:hypothetical protein